MEQTAGGYNMIKGVATESELENYRLCFERNGTDRDMANLRWLHHQNLLQANEIFYAMQDNKIAGIYTALPVLFKINNQLFPALQSIDTLTDMDHRGKGLFIKLANQLYGEAASHDYALVYGFPNDNSAPGFFKKLKWKSFGEAPFLIKPLNPFYFFKKLLNRKKHTDFSSTNHLYDAPEKIVAGSNAEIKRITVFENDYDELWKITGQYIKVCADRSAAYMNWRYVDKPGEHYYRYGFYSNGRLTGTIVFSIKHKHDGLIGYIMELIFDPADKEAGKKLLKFCSRQFKQQKADVVLSWSIPGSFNYLQYKKGGYYSLPEKLRPQKLFIGARILNQSIAAIAEDIHNWYISYSDSDTA